MQKQQKWEPQLAVEYLSGLKYLDVPTLWLSSQDCHSLMDKVWVTCIQSQFGWQSTKLSILRNLAILPGLHSNQYLLSQINLLEETLNTQIKQICRNIKGNSTNVTLNLKIIQARRTLFLPEQVS